MDTKKKEQGRLEPFLFEKFNQIKPSKLTDFYLPLEIRLYKHENVFQIMVISFREK